MALLSRTKPQLEEAEAECKKYGVKTLVVPADMTDEDQVKQAVKTVSPPITRSPNNSLLQFISLHPLSTSQQLTID